MEKYTAIIVGILVGVIIGTAFGAAMGWVAKPVPSPGPDWVSKADFAQLQADHDQLKVDLDKLDADLKAALAELATLKHPMKVGLVLATGGLGDKSFNDLSYAGVVMAENELGIEFDYVQPMAIAEYEGFQRDFAKTGEYVIIICIGFDQAAPLTIITEEYPDQKFALVDMVVVSPNVASLLFQANEGSFLTGVVCGMTTETAKVGFVGGMDNPLIQDFLVGFEAGIKWVNPDVEVLEPVFVGGWADPTKGKEVAQAVIDLGADALFVAAGKSGLGAIEAIHENDIFGFGVDACQDYLYPDIKMMASMTKRVDLAVFEMIKGAVIAEIFQNLTEGVFEGGIYERGLEEGWVGCCRLPEEEEFWETTFNFEHTPLPEEVLTKLTEARDKIITGEIKVPRPPEFT